MRVSCITMYEVALTSLLTTLLVNSLKGTTSSQSFALMKLKMLGTCLLVEV